MRHSHTPIVTYLKPRSFDNGAALVKASMTDERLKEALDDPMGKDASADCVYAVSGLKTTVKPWASLGSKVRSVTLANGDGLKDNTVYQVSFWDGTVKPDYYDAANATRTEGGFESVLTAYLKAKGTVSPAVNGRMTLVWS